MCPQIKDSYRPPNNTNKKAQQCKYGQTNWLKNKMCRQTNASYHQPKNDSYYTVENWLVIYQLKKKNWLVNDSYYTRREIRSNNLIYHVGNDNYRINWLKNKMAQDARKRKVQIKWLKLKLCRQANDSYRLPVNYIGNEMYHINWFKIKMCRQAIHSGHLLNKTVEIGTETQQQTRITRITKINYNP